jgi:phosphoglycolate phosphatase-like HAD superfamily hydrolase
MKTRILDFPFGILDLEKVVLNPGILYRREFGRFLERRFRISAKEALLFYQAHEALPLEVKLQRMLAQHGLPTDQVATVAEEFQEAANAGKPVVSEGAREVLEILLSREIRLFALSTTDSQTARRKMAAAGLDSFFRTVLGVDQARTRRDQIEACARVAGLPFSAFTPQAFFLTGDPEEVAMARELGVYCIGFAHLFPEAAFKAHGAQEVYRHIAHLALGLRGA